MLDKIYNLVFAFKSYLILTVLVIISLVLMALNDNSQIRYIRSVITTAFGIIQEPLSFIPSYFRLKSENELLRRKNIELAHEVNQLREAKLENIRLRKLIGLKEQIPYKLTGARIIGKNLDLLRNTFTLDVGSEDGIQRNMPVINGHGLVGVIVAVSKHYSVMNILLNVDFRASAKIQRSWVDGIIAWNGEDLVLKNVPKTRDVKVGDVVMTSEYSSIFPKNIRIGTVADVKDSETSLFKFIKIISDVDFVKLNEVFVVQYMPDSERVQLEHQFMKYPAR